MKVLLLLGVYAIVAASWVYLPMDATLIIATLIAPIGAGLFFKPEPPDDT